MAEGGGLRQQDGNNSQSQVQLSQEVKRQSSCDTSAERLILQEPINVTFPKVPIQPESSQSKSLTSSSDNYLSSPVFKPRRRRQRSQCSDSEEEDEKPLDSTSSDDKDANRVPPPYRRRLNAVSMRKRKKNREDATKSSEPQSQLQVPTQMHQRLEQKPSVQLKDERIPVLKVIVVGDPYTGKTSLLKSYTQKRFSIEYEETVGTDFFSCTVEYKDKEYRINFWDTAGQERYVQDRRKSLNRSFFKNSSAAFVVFDCCKPSTLNCVTEWKEIIDYMVRQQNGDPIPVFLLANKSDEAQFDGGNLDSLCHEFRFAGHFECSAKRFEGIDKAVKAMVKKVLECGPEVPPVMCGQLSPPPIILNNNLLHTHNINHSRSCTCTHT